MFSNSNFFINFFLFFSIFFNSKYFLKLFFKYLFSNFYYLFYNFFQFFISQNFKTIAKLMFIYFWNVISKSIDIESIKKLKKNQLSEIYIFK